MSDLEEPTREKRRRSHGSHTIHDVAALAGVGSSTVSRYFNAPDLVSPARKQRIEKAIDELNYVHNRMAGGLASAQGRIVAALIPSIANSVFAETVQGLSDVLKKSGYQLLLASTNYSIAEEETALRAFIGWKPGAIVLTGSSHTASTIKLLKSLEIPVIETGDLDPASSFTQVGFSHEEAGRDLTLHFLNQGLRRIRYVASNNPEDFRSQRRAHGYATTMQKAGLIPDVVESSVTDLFDAGAQAIERIAQESRLGSRNSSPQAVIFTNDLMAAGAVLHASLCRITIPTECAVAGFGDFPVSARLSPSITTIKPNRYEIGRKAAQIILDSLSNEEPDVRKQGSYVVPYQLVLRDSTKVRK